MRDVIELVNGIRMSRESPGYLELLPEKLEKILVKEPIQKFYEVEDEPFARGKSAAVKLCRERSSGRQYAAKFLKKRRKSPGLRADTMHEVAVLEACNDCARVVSLHQVFDSPTETVLVLELACGGELQTLLDSDEVPTEGEVVRLMQQIMDGIVYLHSINVAHLDLKPQNLVLTGEYPNCDVKLCDFGISRYLSKGVDVREIQGTPDYVAPEVLSYEPISLASDMWSVGVLTYVLLTGCSPFGGDSKQETFCNITQCRLDFPDELFEDISQEAQDLMTKLMVINPRDRLTAKECLQHPWFTKDFSEPKTVPSTPISTPIQRTPVPARKEQVLQKPAKEPSTETLLPIEDKCNNNPEDNGVFTERKLSSTTSPQRLDNESCHKSEVVLDNIIKKETTEVISETPRLTNIARNDSIKRLRARTMQTMPVSGIARSPVVQNINKQSERECVFKYRQIYINDDSDNYSPPSSISGSSSGSSINASSDAPFGSDSSSDTISDMSIDSDRSSIISLDESIDSYHGILGKSFVHTRPYSMSCYNIWEATRNQRPMTRPLRECNETFAKARSKFSGLAEGSREVKIADRFKLSVFNNRLSLNPPPLVSEKTIALELKKEHNSNTVTIREVKPVCGKRYVRTSEVKCETVRSRIQKLQVYNGERIIKEKYDVF